MDINVENLNYQYFSSKMLNLNSINLKISAGEWILLSGPSGCGKSTFAYALAGILFHQNQGIYSGVVRIGDISIEKEPIYKSADHIGYVQQNPDDQFCTLNVMDELAFGLENKRIDPVKIYERVNEALEKTGALHLKEKQLYELSGGEKQKIAIASILALQPSILILDEPTSNLDIASTRVIFDVLTQLQKEKKLTLVLIEHKVKYFANLFERCVSMQDGRIIYDGTPEKSPFYQIPVKNPNFEVNDIDNQNLLTLSDWKYQSDNTFCLNVSDLTIKKSEIIAVMGANGAGKSTFFRTLTSLTNNGEGQMWFLEQKLNKLTAPDVGLIFQNPDEQIFMQTVEDEILYGINNLDISIEENKRDIKNLCQKFSLNDKNSSNPHKLSFGEKKRLNFISTLALSPKILLLDEVFIGQDINQINFLLQQLQILQTQGISVLLAIHDPNIMTAIADKVIFFENGSMLFFLPTKEAIKWWQGNGYDEFLPQQELKL